MTDSPKVSLPPDDLPRTPSGRVPQWWADERAGVLVDPDPWWTPPAPEPVRRRRSRGVWLVLVLVVTLGSAWWFTGGAPVERLSDALQQVQGSPAVPAPTAEVVALADAAHLSDEGRTIFYGARPEILDATAFAGRCADAGGLEGGHTVGCYHPGAETIVVYRPADPRIGAQAVTTAAHETLHAAWERLTPAEQDAVTPLLEAGLATIPADDEIYTQITGSVGAHPENRPTELFAYLGTQIGALDPQVEQVYARFVADRAALVAVYTGLSALLDEMAGTITTASQALVDAESRNGQDRAQLTADIASREHYRTTYQAKVAEVAVLSAGQRARLRLSWTWWDGTDLPMAPAEDTLALAASLLARDDAAMPARDVTITAAEAAAAAERIRVEGLVTDLNALQAQLDPTA